MNDSESDYSFKEDREESKHDPIPEEEEDKVSHRMTSEVKEQSVDVETLQQQRRHQLEMEKAMKKEEVLKRMVHLKDEISKFEHQKKQLSQLEMQYTSTGDERIILHAKQLVGYLRSMAPVMNGYMQEMNALNVTLNDLNKHE